MKKLLSLILVTVLCVLALASCDTVKGWFDKGEGDGGDVIEYNLPAAVEYLRTMYINDPTATPNDYELVAQVMIKAVKYTVDWSVDNDKVKLTKGETKWTVDVDNFAEEAHNYTLTATITAGDGTKDSSLTFGRTVPKYEVLTYEEFLAAEDDAAVTVNGIITGIVETSKENDLYIQDENGGYFIYAMKALPSELGLKIGMKVSVTGIRDTYYDLPQVKEPVVTIMDSNINPVQPLDITDAFAAAEENKDSLFSQYFSMLVTLKGVKVLGQDTSNDSYYNFSLAGKQSYVRISSSTCMLNADDITAFQNSVASNINNTADVVGIVSNYGGKIYLVPVTKDAFSNFQTVVATNEEKVDYELGKLDFADVTEDGAVTVPVKGEFYNDVVISWAADNACAVVDNTAGTITFTRNDNETAVKLTVTATAGDVTKTKEISIVVDGKIFDGTANLTADKLGLGAYADGEKKVETIKFGFTELGSYGDGIQMRIKDGKFSTLFNLTELPYGIKEIQLVFAESKSTYDNTGAFKFSFGNDASVATYTVNLDTVAGTKTYTITPDATTYKYFKMELLLSYTFYWAEINIVLDMPVAEHTCEFSEATCTTLATCTQPGCGKTQGELLPHVYNEETHACVCEKYDPEWLAIEEEMTIVEALAAPAGKKVKITGTISEIKSAWSEKYGNMEAYLSDADGNKILLWRIKTEVAVNDQVVVSGVITYYNANQIDGSNSATTVTKVCPHDWSDATCQAPKTCSLCNATEGEALPHNFGENGDTQDCQNEGCDVLNPNFHTCNFVATENVVAPTCTAQGYTVYECDGENCNATENRDFVDALAHVDENNDYKCDYNCNTKMLPAADSVLTLEQAIKIAALFGHNTYTADKYYVTGIITDVYNTQYGNMYLKDDVTELFTVYGTYSADGQTAYNSLEVKPVAGDTVTVYGKLGKYGETLQMKDGWITAHEAHTTCDFSVAATCIKGISCAICGAVQAGSEALGHEWGSDDKCTREGCEEVKPAAGTPVKTTSIAAGDVVYLVCETKNMQLSGISTTSTKYGIGTEYTGTINADLYKLTVEAGTVEGSFAFKTADGKYLTWTSGNSLNVNATKSANTSWNITFDADGNAKIVNAADSARVLEWNATNPRFACYANSAQTKVQLYK